MTHDKKPIKKIEDILESLMADISPEIFLAGTNPSDICAALESKLKNQKYFEVITGDEAGSHFVQLTSQSTNLGPPGQFRSRIYVDQVEVILTATKHAFGQQIPFQEMRHFPRSLVAADMTAFERTFFSTMRIQFELASGLKDLKTN